jgi:hypothetical protein
MRVLEFGPSPLVRTVYPESIFVATGMDSVGKADPNALDFSLPNLARIRALLRDPSFDAVFVTRFSSQHDALRLVTLVRLLANHRVWQRGVPAVRIFGDRIIRFGAAPPVIVHDPADAPFVPRNALWLWRRAAAVFKRELPLDRWSMFMRTAHEDVPTPRFRKLARYRSIVEKVRPISLGLSTAKEREIPAAPREKRVDVFFAGLTEANAYVRESGLRELMALRDAGVSIDIPEGRMPREEFFRRCADARLVWSPAGLGQDTFRHYEAAACFSVPLISRPTIEQHRPFTEGETAFFYDPEPGGLTVAVKRALAAGENLPAMARAARSHVLAHHTDKARVDHMLAAARRAHA